VSINLFCIVHIAPALSPTDIYVTDLQSKEATFFWNYEEDTPAGELSGFNIRVHYQDINNPDKVDRKRENFRHIFRIIPGNPHTTFSWVLDEFLLPATDYIVEISATTGGGDGPKARAKFTTPREGLSHIYFSFIKVAILLIV